MGGSTGGPEEGGKVGEQRENREKTRENAQDTAPTENQTKKQQPQLQSLGAPNKSLGTTIDQQKGEEGGEREKEKQIERILGAVANTHFEDLNRPSWEILSGSIGLIKEYIKELQTRAKAEAQDKTSLGVKQDRASWAQGNPFASPQQTSYQKAATTEIITTTRKQSQLLIRLLDQKEREATIGSAGEALIAKFQKGKHPKTDQIIAVNRLQSGDLLLQMATTEAKEALEQAVEWVAQAFPSAVLIRKTFGVIAHGIRITAFDTNSQEANRAKIERDNQDLHPGLKVIRTRWLGSAFKPTLDGKKKLFSSLIVYTATAEMADRLIRRQLIESQEIKTTERYDQASEIMQCFKCYGYGHMAFRCPNKTRCGVCNQEHDTRDHSYTKGIQQEACAACSQQGHPAWSPICPIRIKEKNRAAQRLANRAPLYEPAKAEEQSGSSYRRPSDGFTLVENPRKRRSQETGIEDQRDQRQSSISLGGSSGSSLGNTSSSSLGSASSSGLSIPVITRGPGRPRKFDSIERGQRPLAMPPTLPQFQFQTQSEKEDTTMGDTAPSQC
jgi:hypothetical protein